MSILNLVLSGLLMEHEPVRSPFDFHTIFHIRFFDKNEPIPWNLVFNVRKSGIPLSIFDEIKNE